MASPLQQHIHVDGISNSSTIPSGGTANIKLANIIRKDTSKVADGWAEPNTNDVPGLA